MLSIVKIRLTNGVRFKLVCVFLLTFFFQLNFLLFLSEEFFGLLVKIVLSNLKFGLRHFRFLKIVSLKKFQYPLHSWFVQASFASDDVDLTWKFFNSQSLGNLVF